MIRRILNSLSTQLFLGITRLITGLTVRWAAGVPGIEQRIYIANHSSHFDFLAVWCALPDDVRRITCPVAAADYWSRGLRGVVAARLFHAVLVKRGTQRAGSVAEKNTLEQALKPMTEALESGRSLILFPEGTRGDGQSVAAFRSGIFALCEQQPQLKVMPVYLENFNRVLPKGEHLPVPVVCKVTFGADLKLLPGERCAEFLARAHRALCALREA